MKRWLYVLLLVLFGIAFLICAGFLIDYYAETIRSQKEFDRLAQLVEQSQTLPTTAATSAASAPATPTDPSSATEETVPPETISPYVEVVDPTTGQTRSVLREYAELYTMNSDLVGWMRIDGTKINYPVMQAPDRTDFYLYRGFDRQYSGHGCLYVQEEADVFDPSDNLTIYGHRMKDGTMFSALYNYTRESYFQEHPIIVFDTLTQHNTYQILAVFTTTASLNEGFSYHMFVDADSAAHFADYVATCKALSLYETGVTAAYGDKLITLSTCEYSQVNGRLVVVAKRMY